MEITILDKDFNVVSIFDTWESLLWTSRFSEEGDFEIYSRFDLDLLELFQQDYYLRFRNSDTIMIVNRVEISSVEEEGDYITITGHDLKSILDRRIFEEDTELNGPLVAQIKTKIIEPLFTDPVNPDRDISNFVMDDVVDADILALTIERDISAGDNAFSVIQNVITEAELGFDVYLDSSNVFHFVIYKGEDRSYRQDVNPFVIFSPEFENLLSSRYEHSTLGVRTHVFVQGLTSSYKTTVGDSAITGLNRKEVYISVNTNTTSKMEQAGKEELKHYIEFENFSGEADVRGNFVYGTDFFMGDIVQIKDKYGQEGQVQVTELTIVSAKDGYTSYPTFVKVEDEEEA